MGDLAVAIVDLARNAERRRESRRQFREATKTIAVELLRHLRVGDEVEVDIGAVDSEGFSLPTGLYRVERVTWPVLNPAPPFIDPDGEMEFGYINHPEGAATLVRYDTESTRWSTKRSHKGAVLLDVRTPLLPSSDFDQDWPVQGRSVERVPLADEQHVIQTELYLATDADLFTFADELNELVTQMSSRFKTDADRFRAAVDNIARLGPR
jgi:hypothetical protein